MEKFEEFIINYDSSKYELLPKFMQVRCNALMAVQLDFVKLQKKFEGEIPELEDKYAEMYPTLYQEKSQFFPRKMKSRIKALKELHMEHLEMLEEYHSCLRDIQIKQETSFQSLYVQRHKLITGKLDPKEKLDTESGQEGSWGAHFGRLKVPHFTDVEERIVEDLVDGLPAFWLGALASCHKNDFSKWINKRDRLILRHLIDVRLIYGQVFDTPTYKLEFHFEENDFFNNRLLTKTYFLAFDLDDKKDLFSYGGFRSSKSVGTEINWKPKMAPIKPSSAATGTAKEPTFFDIFITLLTPADGITPEHEVKLEKDFIRGETVRANIIPKAPLYYAGFMDNDDSDESDSE